jgi:GNAT superfamily N-acetyltransferase
MTEHATCIVVLREEQGDAAAALLARAFQDEPLFVYACPDPDARAKWLPWYFRWSVWAGFACDATWGTAGKLAGVAAAISPGGGELNEEHLVRIGADRGREAVGGAVWDQATAALHAVFATADAMFRHTVPEPHWHLDVFGVDPGSRGRGIGSSLLHAVHARADADGVPSALLTRQPRNLPLYQRHGYRVACGGTDPVSGLPWWGLRRERGGYTGRPIAPRCPVELCRLDR